MTFSSVVTERTVLPLTAEFACVGAAVGAPSAGQRPAATYAVREVRGARRRTSGRA
ncbi:hypothetical protein [Streptomyces sp. KL116D]|uniref:hypothetical protein n=1 Tax=Streptomyces sp. KL116D TaxID=3045152 RepID=UPI003558C23F